MKQLVEARCNVDLQQKAGRTPLYAAAQEGRAAVTKELIEARCNISKCLAYSLMLRRRITEQLIEARGNINLQQEDGPLPSTSRPIVGILPSRSCFLQRAVTLISRRGAALLRCKVLSAWGTPQSPR
jgi:ankyrin repeat protein